MKHNVHQTATEIVGAAVQRGCSCGDPIAEQIQKVATLFVSGAEMLRWQFWKTLYALEVIDAHLVI